MSRRRPEAAGTNQLGAVDERLKTFVSLYVKFFEDYLSTKYDQLMEQRGKAGKTADCLNKIMDSGTGNIMVAGGAAGGLIVGVGTRLAVAGTKKLANYFGAKYNIKQCKKLIEPLFEYSSNPQKMKKELVNHACIIFMHYEAQMMNISTSEHWEHAVAIAAKHAVNRVIAQLKEHPEDGFNDTSAIKGILGLPRKDGFKDMQSKLKRKELTMDGKNLRMSELYEKLGIKDDGKYLKYRKTTWPQTGAWFRLRFDCESGDDMKVFDHVESPTNEYTYSLTRESVEEKREYLLREILDSIPLSGANFKELWDETRMEAKRDAAQTIEMIETYSDDIVEIFNSINELKEMHEKHQEKLEAVEVMVAKILVERGDTSRNQPQANKPMRFMLTEPDERFIGREQQLRELDNNICRGTEKRTVSSQTSVISGLGGIGKTQLALRYVEKYCQQRDVLWLDASSSTSLEKCFIRLAQDECGIRTINANGALKDISTILQEVYDYFTNRAENFECLVVFNNALSPDEIKDYLPKFGESLRKTKNALRILITTRCAVWPDVAVLPLEVFEIQEAVQLVKACLKISDTSQDDAIIKLVETLQYFPLAVAQAVAYIRFDDYTINDYLQEYQKNAQKLLDDKSLFDHLGHKYLMTTYNTWDMTVNKISESGKYGAQASLIIKIAAFIHPDSIDTDMFHRLYPKDEVQRAVRLLAKYSMVNVVKKEKKVIIAISLHRLVQQVMRLKMDPTGREEIIIDKAIAVLVSDVPKEKVDYLRVEPEFIARLRRLQPHLDVLEKVLGEKTFSTQQKETKARIRNIERRRDVLDATLAIDGICFMQGWEIIKPFLALVLGLHEVPSLCGRSWGCSQFVDAHQSPTSDDDGMASTTDTMMNMMRGCFDDIISNADRSMRNQRKCETELKQIVQDLQSVGVGSNLASAIHDTSKDVGAWILELLRLFLGDDRVALAEQYIRLAVGNFLEDTLPIVKQQLPIPSIVLAGLALFRPDIQSTEVFTALELVLNIIYRAVGQR